MTMSTQDSVKKKKSSQYLAFLGGSVRFATLTYSVLASVKHVAFISSQVVSTALGSNQAKHGDTLRAWEHPVKLHDSFLWTPPGLTVQTPACSSQKTSSVDPQVMKWKVKVDTVQEWTFLYFVSAAQPFDTETKTHLHPIKTPRHLVMMCDIKPDVLPSKHRQIKRQQDSFKSLYSKHSEPYRLHFLQHQHLSQPKQSILVFLS